MSDSRHRARPRPALPSFQSLLDAHAADVLRFLQRRLPPADAEDCFQETWLAALRAYPAVTDGANLRGWLLTIARNKAIDLHRSSVRQATTVAGIGASVVAPEPADGALWDEVRSLPAKQQAAVALRFVDDRDYADIADVMRTSEAAARRNVHEGIRKLRRNRT